MKIEIKTVKLGAGQVAVTTLGGIMVRGARAESKVGAVRNLLYKLSQSSEDDAAVGLELELENTTIEAAFHADAVLPASEA